VEGTAAVAARVKAARRTMAARNPGGLANAELPAKELKRLLNIEAKALQLWEAAIGQRRLTARSAERLLRVAQTITDLDGGREIGMGAIAEALSYRSFDQVADR
jgi:magnesium chelatase family protein